MLTPRASGMNIFDHDYNYIFRMCGSNEVYADTLADYMSEKNYKRIAIFYSDDEYGNDFAKTLEKQLSKRSIVVVDRETSITASNIDAVLQRWNAFGCDGVIMAASYPTYIEPIKLIWSQDKNIPFFGADNFDYTDVTLMAEEGVGNIHKISIDPEKLNQDFLTSYRDKYAHDPDLAAIFGYEAVFLLKDAMQETGSIDGSAIAGYLSSLENYESIIGIRSYNVDTREFDGVNVVVQELK